MAVRTTNKRRNAVQARSKATVERILSAAMSVIAEKGADSVTMTEIAHRSNVVIGSLYQYFSDKTEIMRAILENHNADVELMVRRALADVESMDGLLRAMNTMTDTYFHLHRTNPLYKSIWSAVQTDAELQAIDIKDTLSKAKILFDAAKPLYRDVDEAELMAVCCWLMQSALVAARFALSIPRSFGRRMPSVFQKMSVALLMNLEEGAS